jgi:RimJ/RimL family protein N-acetyltransferase
MIDAYVGTIDYEDEDYDDAVEEVRGYLDGDPLLENSYLAEVAGEVASAVLVELVDGAPFIGYVMTVPTCKGSGLARLVTTTAMSSPASDGYSKVVFYITVGNKPSEALFKSVGAIPALG